MASRIVPEDRIRKLNDKPVREGRFLLYWMQQSQRAEDNHALEVAIQLANERSEPLLVGFGLTSDYPEANARHYRFMLEGLAETSASLERRGVRFALQRGAPDEVALRLAGGASQVVVDRGYLRHQREWRDRVADGADCAVTEVESDVIVPVEVASDKAEYAARTLRPKLHRQLDAYLIDLATTPLEHPSLDLRLDDLGGTLLDPSDPVALAGSLGLDDGVPPVSALYRGGTTQAKRTLRTFLDERFARYAEHRNQPQTDDVSHMSKYLHFGQISPLYLVRAAMQSGAPQADRDAFIEEVVVRRELAVNFVRYTDHYDRYAAIPSWAAQTLADHAGDPREYLYNDEELIGADTHDPYWNAAMNEMRDTGYLHNYMRMYWGKKILEWSASPEQGFERTLRINNRYLLDGRDANSFTGVSWCYGLHDRPWQERPVFGKVRYMNAAGLRRKADPDAYIDKVERLRGEAGAL